MVEISEEDYYNILVKEDYKSISISTNFNAVLLDFGHSKDL